MNFNINDFELFLFTTNPSLAKECLDAGINGIIIDWENKEKDARQNGYPTQINYDTSEDLMNMRKSITGKIICRINKFNNNYSEEEINTAIELGANELFLPMVEEPVEVEQALEIIQDRCKLGILVETDTAVKNATQFAHLPLSRIYIGLNDLHISRKSKNIFEPLTDDTVKYIRSVFSNIPVGVGGITHPKEGHPIPAELLIKQYVNLKMNFSFLRRSFIKDLNAYDVETLVKDIREALQNAHNQNQMQEMAFGDDIKSYF